MHHKIGRKYAIRIAQMHLFVINCEQLTFTRGFLHADSCGRIWFRFDEAVIKNPTGEVTS